MNFNLEQYYSNGHYVVHAENLCNDEKSFIEFFSKKSQLYVGYGNYNSSNYQPINHSSIIEEYNLRSEVIAKDKAAEYKKSSVKFMKLGKAFVLGIPSHWPSY